MTPGISTCVDRPDDREKFKMAAEAKIREKLPPSGNFRRLVPRKISNFGDDTIISSGFEGAYNIPLDGNYATIFKKKNPVLVYHQYVCYPGHGAELAAVFRDLKLPGEFSVCTRASTVKWVEDWPRPVEILLERTSQGLFARTVEYAMVFDVESDAIAEAMLEVIDNLFTLKEGRRSEPGSWEIPDVRLVGVEKAQNTEKVCVNHFLGNRVITLAKICHPGVEYKREILVNKLLGEVID